MKLSTKCVLSVGVLAVLVAGLAFPAGASHSSGLTQTVSALLNLPAVATPSAEVCTGADANGNPTNCTPISVGTDARQLGLSMTYTLVNASHLPSVSAVAGSAAVPCPVPNSSPTTYEKKTGIALIAEEANFKSGSTGSLTVNGEEKAKVPPSGATQFYPAQAIFIRFCTI